MNCSNCQADVPAGNQFCIECGAALPTPCPACRKLNPPTAKFCGGCGATLTTSTDRTPIAVPPPLVKPVPTAAERRQLTVMFCDLVGSTALSARMDPEDLRNVIGAYHHCVAETVARFKGFVAKYMGDGVLVYFGYPGAHEDDVERADRGPEPNAPSATATTRSWIEITRWLVHVVRSVPSGCEATVGADHSFGLVDDDLLTLLFVIVYRYQQTREEVWRNGRLIARASRSHWTKVQLRVAPPHRRDATVGSYGS